MIAVALGDAVDDEAMETRSSRVDGGAASFAAGDAVLVMPAMLQDASLVWSEWCVSAVRQLSLSICSSGRFIRSRRAIVGAASDACTSASRVGVVAGDVTVSINSSATTHSTTAASVA